MNEVEAAWVAGLFEGEGCILLTPYSEGSRHHGLMNRRLSVMMSDEDVVRKLHSITGVGTVGFIRERAAHWKPTWRWNVYAWTEITAVLDAILPHLGERRAAKARELLACPPRRQAGRPRQDRCCRQHPLEGPDADVLHTKEGTRVCRKCRRERDRVRREAA